jgi:hypothetical protein
MNRHAVVGIVVASAVAGLVGCARTDAPPGPDGPTLSLVEAEGVDAELRRTVTEISGGRETVLSAVDTSVWAPFDGDGAALAAPGAGIPGPLGKTAASVEGTWDHDGKYRDSTGVLHELWVSGKGRNLLERMRYVRNRRLVVAYQGTWVEVAGGVVREQEAMTFYPPGLPAVRVDVAGLDMQVASASPLDHVLAVGTRLTDLFRPTPLAAQFHFGACSKEWLGWGGAALLAELAWVRFVRSKTPRDFKLAVAATGAAGVALDKLVDCMLEQPYQPTE